jgi:hypothetical protein
MNGRTLKILTAIAALLTLGEFASAVLADRIRRRGTAADPAS